MGLCNGQKKGAWIITPIYAINLLGKVVEGERVNVEIAHKNCQGGYMGRWCFNHWIDFLAKHAGPKLVRTGNKRCGFENTEKRGKVKYISGFGTQGGKAQ